MQMVDLYLNKGWTARNAPDHITECSGTKMFGGLGKFGTRAVAMKQFAIPPHSSITLEFDFWKYRIHFD